MKHKLFRGLVALVLVCVLVVNVSPIRAQASALPEVAEVVTKVIPFNPQAGAAAGGAALGSQVFFWVLLGLGLIVKTAQAIDLMNRYEEWSGELETSIYYYPDGSWSYGVDMTFVESVRAFLFDSGIVVPYKAYGSYVSDDIVSHSYLDNGNLVTKEAIIRDAGSTVFSYRVCDNGKHYDLFYSASAFKVSYSGVTGALGKTVGDVSFYYVMKNYGVANSLDTNTGNCVPGDFTSVDLLLDVVAKLISSNGSFVEGSSTEIEYVAPLEVPIPDAYPDWYTNARPAVQPDTDEEITVLPIPLNPSADPETQIGTLTQPDIWQGSIADPLPDSGTDTDPDTDGSLSQTPWETFKKWISEGWKTIIQAIPTADSIAQSIGNVIKPIFVPDADFISEKWNAIRSRFDFADSISSSGELILDVLNGIDPEPPVIYVDLGDAEGSYYLGGQVAFLDLRWYERYKPTGDAIISAFLWLVFVWRMFIKLPGIIGGLPGDFVMQGVTDLGLADWLPARKKEYENLRQVNRMFFKK